jgi:hypothetical protein
VPTTGRGSANLQHPQRIDPWRSSSACRGHDRPDIAPLALARALLFRLLTYGLEIPLGAVTYLIWQRKKSWRKPLHPPAPAAVPAPPA